MQPSVRALGRWASALHPTTQPPAYYGSEDTGNAGLTLPVLGLPELADAADRMLFQNSALHAQMEAIQDMRLGLLMRVAILYKFILLVAVTCLVVAMYALAATYKQIVQSLVSRLLNSMSRAVVADPDADYAWFDDGRPARVPQVRFSDSVEVTATYSAAEYDRRENRRAISPELMTEARKFLLDYKLHEMPVHPASRQNTHIFKLR